MNTTSADSTEALQFLLKDYGFKIKYVSDHFSRMWTRFNFFLALESGLCIDVYDEDDEVRL